MKLKSFLTVTSVALASAACAGHKPAHTAPDESQPHITWDIRSGGSEGEGVLVCDSAQAKPSCAIDAGTTERRTSVISICTLPRSLSPTRGP